MGLLRLSRPIERPTVSATNAAVITVFAVALGVYVRTLLPGSSFGDWGEMQLIPAQLGVPHPTGYPLYVLIGKAFSLLPIGSVAYRADLLSAFAAAGAAAGAVLISIRLGVRPLIAAMGGLTLAVTGTLWLEATFSEMNGLHLFLVALVIHRALVWRAERRDADLRLGGLLAGLAVANHLLAVTVVPIVIVFVLVDARARLIQRPVVLVQAALLFLAGVALYAYIPLRALAGPADVYGPLLTWDGLSSLISGAQFRSQMDFGSGESLSIAWRAVPEVTAQIQERSNVVFVVGGLMGGAILFVRDRWAAALLAAVALVNVYFFANYVGNLDHYLLVTWLVMAIWLSVAAQAFVDRIEQRPGARVGLAQVLLLLLPLYIAVSNWPTHDQSANRVGDDFSTRIFGALPQDALLVTYWDALTNLSYAHCIEGQRPDLSLRAYDGTARVSCDQITDPLEDVARTRPVFALFPFDHDLDRLRGAFDLLPGPMLGLPYGDRDLDHSGILYRLQPKGVRGSPGPAARRPDHRGRSPMGPSPTIGRRPRVA